MRGRSTTDFTDGHGSRFARRLRQEWLALNPDRDRDPDPDLPPSQPSSAFQRSSPPPANTQIETFLIPNWRPWAPSHPCSTPHFHVSGPAKEVVARLILNLVEGGVFLKKVEPSE